MVMGAVFEYGERGMALNGMFELGGLGGGTLESSTPGGIEEGGADPDQGCWEGVRDGGMAD